MPILAAVVRLESLDGVEPVGDERGTSLLSAGTGSGVQAFDHESSKFEVGWLLMDVAAGSMGIKLLAPIFGPGACARKDF